MQNRLYLNDNQLQRLPSAMTRLTNLEWCVFVVAFCWLMLIALCRLNLSGNAALLDELQQNVYNRNETQALLQRIGAHYGGEHILGFENALTFPPSKAMDKHCRASIVCMIGMRKFGRCAMMAPVGKDAMLMIARLMWNDCVDGAWVLRNE